MLKPKIKYRKIKFVDERELGENHKKRTENGTI